MDLLEVGIVLVLVVIALSLQLHQGFGRQRVENPLVEALPDNFVSQGHLHYSCNALEMALHFAVLEEKKEQQLVYEGKDYSVEEFLTGILGINWNKEQGKLYLGANERTQMQNRMFTIYQTDGKWRVEE